MSCVYQAWLRTVRMLTISRVEASQAWYRPRALDLTKPVYFSRCAFDALTEDQQADAIEDVHDAPYMS